MKGDVMQYKEFLTYHPYLTYSDPLNTGFVNPDGKQKESDTSDRDRLFRLGREVYKRLGECTSKTVFDEATSGYYKLLDEFRLLFSEMANEKKIIPAGGKDKVIGDIKWDAEQIADIAWQLFSRGETISSDSSDETDQIFSQFFLFQALKEIDHANVALNLGEPDAVYAGIEAANALANAIAIQSGNEKLQKARQEMSLSGAKARHAATYKLRNDIITHWRENIGADISNEFAAELLQKEFPNVAHRTLVKYVAEAKKLLRAGTL